jgi:hypothetical protein
MLNDSFCGNAALQVFFAKPAAAPAAAQTRAVATASTADQGDGVMENVTLVTADPGFAHGRDHAHVREPYPR